MLAQSKNHFRAVSSSEVGLDSLNVTSASTRDVQSWVPSARESAKPRWPVRSFSAESLHVIPQTKDIESQFQTVLGKCLFDKAVQIAEEDGQAGPNRSSPVRPGSSESLCSSRAGSYGSSGANSPMILDSRTTLNLRPTRCASPLVKGSRSFDSYINKGSIDQYAVAKTRGAIDSSKPSINRYLRRVRTASDQNLNDFSLKAEFTDRMRETDREQYWRRKQEEKIVEEELRERKRKEKTEMLVILEDMKKEYEERKAKEEKELLRFKLEEERIAKEKELALVESTENQNNIDEVSSVVSTSSKSSKKRSSKKGRGSKRDKISKKGKSASRKSAKKKSSIASSPLDGEAQRSGSNAPQPILKLDERTPSDDGSGGTGQTKRVTFREKLVSTRTIGSHKPICSRKGSPRKPFPGSSSSPNASEPRSSSPTPGDKRKKSSRSKGKRGSSKGGKKGTKKTTIVDPAPTVEPPTDPEPPVPEPVVEPETQEPQEPVVIVVDEPPVFCPAGEYKTRKQMVEEWLYYRSCSASCRANPPML